MRTCRGDAWPGHAVAPIAGRLSIRRLLPPEETTVAASGTAARYRKSSHWGLPVPIDQGVRGGRSPKPSAPRVEAPVRFAWVVATATLVPFCAIGIRVHGGARSLALYQRVIVAIDIDGKVAFRCQRALGASPASPATSHRTRAGPAPHHICPPRRESPTLTGVGDFRAQASGLTEPPYYLLASCQFLAICCLPATSFRIEEGYSARACGLPRQHAKLDPVWCLVALRFYPRSQVSGCGVAPGLFSGLPPEVAEGAVAVGPFSIFRVTRG